MATYVRSIKVGDKTFHISASSSGKELYYSSSSKTGGSSLRGLKLVNHEFRSTSTGKAISENELAQAIVAAKAKSSSGCFITTAVVNKLALPDDHIVLNTLREYRDEYLAKNREYMPLLAEYDLVGPVLSERVLKMPIANVQNLFDRFLTPAVGLIKQHRHQEAVQVYTEMILLLKRTQ